ncbi:chaperone protein DnaJ 2-like [Zingiber officinale]|uniref:chaperone protein DnaJ 2-like n=1 Tax=Zingiber officinale TaxID=94328 RepID=UPI001C4ABD3D|nr:chaperone protein DnaJ 2-like [Zingiber officinale]
MYSLPSFTSGSLRHAPPPLIISCTALARSKPPNFYEVLSLDTSGSLAGPEEIKRAYRRLALRCHPDLCSAGSGNKEECTRRFIELHQAYVALSDPALRRKHDMELRGIAGGNDGSCRQFSREVWEAQLHKLWQRSTVRRRGRAAEN